MAGSLPITFKGLGNEKIATPLSVLQKTIASLQPDEVLVRIAYASLNPMDPKIQQSGYFSYPMPLFLGFDFSGTIVALGSNAPAHGGPDLAIGSEVLGMTLDGGCFAEYAVVKRTFVVPRGAIPAAEAAAYGIAYCTAYESIVITGQISEMSGKTIFIAGAAGGVGHFAVLLAKAHGLRVIGSASKPESIALLRKLGVDHVIDYSKQDVVKEVLAVTAGRGVDVAYDPTYKVESGKQSAATVAKGGRWIKLGSWSDADAESRKIVAERGGNEVLGDLGRYGQMGVRPGVPEFVAQAHKVREGLERAVGWHQEGKVRPHIAAIVPFDAAKVQAAFDDNLKGRINTGKVVIKIGA